MLTSRRRFYMDGMRQLVREPDGFVHEVDPGDPDLIAQQRLGVQFPNDEVARLIAVIHRQYQWNDADTPGDHLDEMGVCAACDALLQLANIY